MNTFCSSLEDAKVDLEAGAAGGSPLNPPSESLVAENRSRLLTTEQIEAINRRVLAYWRPLYHGGSGPDEDPCSNSPRPT